MDDAERRERNLECVRAAFAGVSSADAVRQLANYTDDMVLELPYASPAKRVETKAAALPYLSSAFENFHMQLTITEVHACLDPDELIVEFTSTGQIVATGAPYGNRYIAVFRFRDGKICFQREFYNPAPPGQG